MSLLIIGCSRSGTQYISRVLCASGLDVGHELVGRDGMVSWGGAVESFIRGRSEIGKGGIEYKKEDIWHQIRDPLRCISLMSLVHDSLRDKQWNAAELTKVDGPDILNWALYWITWNRLCEDQASRTYRVEDIDSVYPEMLKWRGLPNQELPDISKRSNARGPGRETPIITYAVFRENMMVYDAIRSSAEYYGYGG